MKTPLITLSAMAAFLALPLASNAQVICSAADTASNPAIETATDPVDIAPGKPFNLVGRFCPGPIEGASVKFFITDRYNNVFLTATATPDASGVAIAPVPAGLPAGHYYLVPQGINVPLNFPSGGGSQFYVGGGPSASLVNGQFTFLLQGTMGTGALHTGHLAVAAGTIQADGQGNITGVVDLNAPEVSLKDAPVTGHYTATGSDGGMDSFTLETPIGRESIQVMGIPVSNDNGNSPAFTHAFLATENGGNFIGTGNLLKRTLPLVYPQLGFYAIQLTGETACDTACVSAGQQVLPLTLTGSAFLPKYGVGRPIGYSLSGIFTQGTTAVQGFREASYSYGAYIGTDDYGRTELMMDPSTLNVPGLPTNYVMYLADIDHGFLVSTDSHVATPILFGTLSLQQN